MNCQVEKFCELFKEIIHPSGKTGIDKDIDWNYLVQLSKEHNLLPLFLETAIQYQSYVSRSAFEKEVRQGMNCVHAQIKRTNAFLELYKAFVQADIYPIVMKGIICRELYGKLCDHRPSGDEDILIRPSEYKRAKEVLVASGYVTNVSSEVEEQLERLQEISFVHPGGKLHIELHFNAFGKETKDRVQMSNYFKNVFENYREVDIQGVSIRTMNHQDHLVFLILHTFKHFTFGGFGIRQVLDILLYQERYGADIDIGKVYDILREFKAHIFWADIMHIGNQYLGFELEISQEPNCPDDLLEDMITCGVFGNKTEAAVVAGRATMRASENYLWNRKSNAFVMLLRNIFPNKAYMLDQAPYLKKEPWLLPVAWIKRWVKFIKKNRHNEANLASESIQISQRRMKLLKKYDLV